MLDQPTVANYRKARDELRASGETVCQATLDQHVIGQLTGEPYLRLSPMPIRKYKPLLDELAVLTMPPPVRATGTGPWDVVRCGCCRTCLTICTCRDLDCGCGAEPLCTVRVMYAQDLKVVAPHGSMDAYAMAELLTGEDIAAWPYGDYRTVDAVIGRSIDSPFYPWNPDASQSPPGDK